jgi:hypothetical protein
MSHLLRRGAPETTRRGKGGVPRASSTSKSIPILSLSPCFPLPTLLLLLHLAHIPPAGGYDLGLYEPAAVGARTPGLQLAAYKFYSKLYSIPNLDARPPDLITWLSQLNQPRRYGTWPEVYALNATPPQGFERYDGRTYGECTAVYGGYL